MSGGDVSPEPGQVLRDRVAVITGAGSGIGRATAELFASAGAYVVAADVSGAERDVADALGERCAAVHVDVSDEADVQAMFAAATRHFGGTDVLCNVAGIGTPGALIGDFDVEQFDRELAVNLRGVFLTMRYGIPEMLSRGGGAVVNWSSGAGLRAVPLSSAYVASKAAVIQLTQAAAIEYGGRGLRANALCPGGIRTPFSERIIATQPGLSEQIIATIPAGRLGEASEVAQVALFLASDAASYVNGVALAVDGGMHSSR